MKRLALVSLALTAASVAYWLLDSERMLRDGLRMIGRKGR